MIILDQSVSFARGASRGSEMDYSKQHKKKYDAEGNAKSQTVQRACEFSFLMP